MMTKEFYKHWLAHPFRNKFFNRYAATRRHFNRSRWLPHQGKRECARRVEQGLC
jgi:hypothetical protein